MIRPRSIGAGRHGRVGQALRWVAVVATLFGIAGARPARAVNFSYEQAASVVAWSGYWWPMLTSRGFHLYDTQGAYTPLLKYGQWTGDYRPLEWNRRYHLTTNPANDWWGHCNGWAAAAVLEPEPKQSIQMGGVTFNVGDLKGLLSAAHNGDPNDLFRGARLDRGADHRTDLRAKDFHQAVLYYLGERREGVIFNISRKPEVWNYPADAFRMRGETDRRNPGLTHVTTTLYFGDNDVAPNYVGQKWFSRQYTYWILGDPQSPNGVQAADWTGNSVYDHPQFVWHPAYARSYDPAREPPNPLDYNRITQLVRAVAQ